MKLRKRICSFLLVLFVGLLPCLNVSAYTTVNLGGEGSGTAWDKSTMTGNFSVKVDSSVSTAPDAYRIVDITYDSASQEFTSKWAASTLGQNWIDTWMTANYKQYPTPASLAAANQKTQDAVYKAMLNWIVDTQGQAVSTVDKALKLTGTVQEGTSTYNFTNAAFGQYLIAIKDASNSNYFAPLTVNVAPTRDAATGEWVMKPAQVSMKFSDVGLVKTIDQDQVAVGDTVHFTITADMPTYPAGMDAQKKIFIIDDNMSGAFSYNTGTLKIYGTKEDGTKVELPADYYTSVISSNVTVYSCPTTSHRYFNIYRADENGTSSFYFLRDGVMNLLYSTTNVTSNTLSYYGPVFSAYQKLTGDRIGHGLSAIPVEKNLFNVNFDYAKLADAGYTGIHMEYDATVTESAQIGTDNNTNTAYLYYAKDINGTTTSVNDKVTAWTYGVTIVKVDGDTIGADGTPSAATKYLAGATFILYERVGSYTGDINTEGDAKTAYDADLAKYEQLGKTRTIPVYGEDGSTISGYELYAEAKDSITTTATKEGVKVNGVKPGVYLLEETLAPQGYNLLADALKFEIKKSELDTESGEQYGKRESEKTFMDEADTEHVTGYYDLVVRNYKGLTLPETGGAGTAGFSMTGIALMAAAMLLVLARKKGEVR